MSDPQDHPPTLNAVNRAACYAIAGGFVGYQFTAATNNTLFGLLAAGVSTVLAATISENIFSRKLKKRFSAAAFAISMAGPMLADFNSAGMDTIKAQTPALSLARLEMP